MPEFEVKQKKCYSTPMLKTHGSVEQLTQSLVKSGGGALDFFCQRVNMPSHPSHLL